MTTRTTQKYPHRMAVRTGVSTNKPFQFYHYNATSIKEHINPLEFYLSEIPTMPKPKHQSDWVPGGLCPFHDDHHAGNFRVNLKSGSFYCFACGTSGGDIIQFTRKRYGLEFQEALRRLAREWRISS